MVAGRAAAYAAPVVAQDISGGRTIVVSFLARRVVGRTPYTRCSASGSLLNGATRWRWRLTAAQRRTRGLTCGRVALHLYYRHTK